MKMNKVDKEHPLLESRPPAYSNMTLRRAFIVWMRCGQVNDFKHVCNYFHALETFEEKLSPEYQVASRLLEFNLLSSQPPNSNFLKFHFPYLYKENKTINVNSNLLEDMSFNDFVFTLHGYDNPALRIGIPTSDIVRTSEIIRKYCRAHSRSLRLFELQFLDFIKKCKLELSVKNIPVYLRKQYIKDELEIYNSMKTCCDFMLNDDTTLKGYEDKDTNIITNGNIEVDAEDDTNAIKSPSKMTELIENVNRRELLNGSTGSEGLEGNNMSADGAELTDHI